MPAPPRPPMEYFRRFDEFVDTDEDENEGSVDFKDESARDCRIAAAGGGRVAAARRVMECGGVRTALPAPPRPVEV